LASFREVNDPRLHRLGRKAQSGEHRRQRIQRADGLPAVLAHHDEIVGVAHQDPVACVLQRARQEVRFEDRLEHDPPRALHDTITNRRDRQRPPLIAVGLRDEDPTRRERTVAAITEVRGQLVEHPVNPA